MNKKGVAVALVLAYIAGAALVGLVIDKSLDMTINKNLEQKLPEVKIYATELTKVNGKLIWCKMQNKGAEYCNNLYK